MPSRELTEWVAFFKVKQQDADRAAAHQEIDARSQAGLALIKQRIKPGS